MRRSLILIFCFTLGLIKAQPLVSIYATDVYIDAGADVFISGDLTLSADAEIVMQGNLTVDGSISSEATYQQSGSLHVSNNISLFGDNQLFGAASEVYLNGGNQVLEGGPLFIGALYCLGTDEKVLKTDVFLGQLFLDSSRVFSESNTLEIQASALSSLSYTTGWVRSDSAGMLSRNMNSGLTYDFPIGTNTERLLARITPSVDGTRGMRYGDADASDDGLFRTQVEQNLCSLNPDAYIRLYNTLGSENTLEIRFPQFDYSLFPVVCERSSEEFASWALLSQESPFEEDNQRVFTINPTQDEASIILGRIRPESPEISGELEACQGDNSYVYEAETPLNNLVWTVGGGELINQQNQQVEINWGFLQTGLVSVVASDDFGCSSLPTSLEIVLHPLPEAIITVEPPLLPFEQEVFTLESQSILSNSLFWELDGSSDITVSTIELKFDSPGTYLVTLHVISEEGCTDTAQVNLVVEEGFIFSNVFSPNGDGINDKLLLPNSGLDNFSFIVWTRWGNEVFRTSNDKVFWDGRDLSGNLVPSGTYFYELRAKSSNNDYSKKGSIQVIY